jgi:succinate-acetate transporter protein
MAASTAPPPPTVRYREGPEGWRDRSRVVLTPIAAPSILGLFGFAGATFMVGAHLAGWYGSPTYGLLIFPFATTFGGIAQFTAAIWSYRARDGLATAMHGMWGAFWLAFGILWGAVAAGAIPAPAGFHDPALSPLGYWFIVLGVITFMGFIASLAENIGLATVLFTLAIGSALNAINFLTGVDGWDSLAGWFFMVSAWLAVYTASAMMLEGTFGRTILPLGHVRRRGGNIPGDRFTVPIEWEHGMPGARQGQ